MAEFQDTLERQAREVARLRQSRTSRQLRVNGEGGPLRALDTPMENLIAATRIANSLQPSGSAAEGIEHLAFLLQKAVEQNAEVSQSLQRVHSQPPSRAPLNLFTLLGETEIIHLGTEEILMMNIAMSSTGIQNSEGKMNTQLGGGRMSMQLGGWTEMPQEEMGLNDVGWTTKGRDTVMLKMMLGAI